MQHKTDACSGRNQTAVARAPRRMPGGWREGKQKKEIDKEIQEVIRKTMELMDKLEEEEEKNSFK